MRVLWVTNVAIGDFCEKLHLEHPASGGWMEALLKDFKQRGDIRLGIATPGATGTLVSECLDGVNYYLLPGGLPPHYHAGSPENIRAWEQVVADFNPDIINLWGSEYAHGLDALVASPGIPSVVYIQGLLAMIERYYYAGLTFSDLIRSVTIRDLLKLDTITLQKWKVKRQARFEQTLLRRSGNVICENTWAHTHCMQIAPDCKVYQNELNLRAEFYQERWNIQSIERHTLFCNASGYPLKGLHILLKAFALVKASFPDARLYIPGVDLLDSSSFRKCMKRTGYALYIKRLITSLGLTNSVHFLGFLSAGQMARRMAQSHVFVVPSALENHSSTLREAMVVGTPSISSFVGGVPEVVHHGSNGLLYRFEEFEQLAEHIHQLFVDDEQAILLSEGGSQTMRQHHNSHAILDKMIRTYTDVIAEPRQVNVD